MPGEVTIVWSIPRETSCTVHFPGRVPLMSHTGERKASVLLLQPSVWDTRQNRQHHGALNTCTVLAAPWHEDGSSSGSCGHQALPQHQFGITKSGQTLPAAAWWAQQSSEQGWLQLPLTLSQSP